MLRKPYSSPFSSAENTSMTYKGLAKTTPTHVKGKSSFNRNPGRGEGGGTA